jgi:hypothetical protein
MNLRSDELLVGVAGAGIGAAMALGYVAKAESLSCRDSVLECGGKALRHAAFDCD